MCEQRDSLLLKIAAIVYNLLQHNYNSDKYFVYVAVYFFLQIFTFIYNIGLCAKIGKCKKANALHVAGCL